MVEVASTLVLEKLSQLDPAAGLETEAEAEAGAEKSARPNVSKPVAVNRPQTTKKRKPRRKMPDPNDKDVRFVGGIWLV